MTIIISCAPAVSSFWTNSVAKSAFYSKLSSLGSGLISFRASRSSTAKEKSSTYSNAQQPSGSTTRLNDSGRYYELQDGVYGGTATTIQSPRVKSLEQEGVITKMTTIDHVSERLGRADRTASG